MAPKKKLTAAARRAQLIEVGRSAFAEKGYEATSVEEIAERAKVSKPIVYEHFGIMSHPIEGWIVNALGHAVGGRNFETSDNTRNNHLAAGQVLGEG